MRLAIFAFVVAGALALAGHASAEDIVVQMNLISGRGVGKAIGTVTLSDTLKGLRLAPELSGLPPGVHGFHVHEKPDCGSVMKDGKSVAGLAAGGHYDPAGTGKHEGPLGKGHEGDLPALKVEADGKATESVYESRLKAADVKGRSLVIHDGGDNYSDAPKKLGGGGGRIACGVIK